jgi:uncharacterized protein (DUF305 family)
MKLNIVLIAFAIISGACGNNTNSTTSDADTSELSRASNAVQTSASQDTSTPENGLMTAMTSMMDKMHSVQMSGDFDVDFASMMIEHHQGAIDMSQFEILNGKDERIKVKAEEMLKKQQKEQQELKAFVSSYKTSGMKHGEGELQKAMETSMSKMKSMSTTGSVDKDFAGMMISHHEVGIAMGKMELKNGMSAKLKKMTKKSIDDQQKDISELKMLQSNRE